MSTKKPTTTGAAEEIEWDDEDDAAADASWREVDRQLRALEAMGNPPTDDDGMPDGVQSLSQVEEQ